MDEAYRFHLKQGCIKKGWTFEDCDIGVKINGILLETLKELDSFIESETEKEHDSSYMKL